MSEQTNQNPTPTVQVTQIGLPEQTAAIRAVAMAGIAAGAIGAVAYALKRNESTTPESSRMYLRNALEEAQAKDLAKAGKRQRKRVQKNLEKQRAKVSNEAEMVLRRSRTAAADTAATVRNEANSFVDTLKSGGAELDKVVEGFAESTLMAKLREFGEEAREISEQGKLRGADLAHQAQENLVPQVKDAAKQAKSTSKERIDEVVKTVKEEVIPQAHHLSTEARESLHNISDDAERKLSEATAAAEHKRKQAEQKMVDAAAVADQKLTHAASAVKQGGRDAQSLLLWLSLAGILIFSVFLSEEQQKKLKEVAIEVFSEAKDMYLDMKGDHQI